ncbi:hypothetical protein ACQP3J_00770 [Escherichia coli]
MNTLQSRYKASSNARLFTMLYLRSWRSDICPPRDSRYTCGL